MHHARWTARWERAAVRCYIKDKGRAEHKLGLFVPSRRETPVTSTCVILPLGAVRWTFL